MYSGFMKEKQFWERVSDILKQRNLRIVDLSEMSGVDQRVISSAIRKNSMPAADRALIIANCLGVQLSSLLWDQSDTDDPDFDESIGYIRKSRRQCEIVKKIPYLNNDQLAGIEALLSAFDDRSGPILKSQA